MACETWIFVRSTGRSGRILAGTLLALAGVLPPGANAQQCGSGTPGGIATDRPQVTNSSVVVPCGSLQFENGFQVTGNGSRPGVDLPETSVRFGVAAKTELRLTVPDYFYKAETGSGFFNGFGDLSLGFKQQLGPKAGFDLSLIPSVSFPSGADSLSSHGFDPSLQLPWSRGFAKSWTAAGQLGLVWPTTSGRRDLTGQSSFYLDRQLTPPWDAYVEYSGAFPERGGPMHLIDFGTAYKPAPHQQLDVHAGFGLSSSVPSYSIGFGYSFRFD